MSLHLHLIPRKECASLPVSLLRRYSDTTILTSLTHPRAPLFTTRTANSTRSTNSSSGSNEDTLDVESIARPMGYGPFSATAKARVKRDQATGSADSSTAAGIPNVALDTNLPLRLSLAALPHPTQLRDWSYMSPEWRVAFVRLYRTILRLHNKTVAVSLELAQGAGPEAAVSAVTGVQDTHASAAATTNLPASEEDVLLRYLLTPEQQEFGNRFVQGEFQRHLDADAVSATTFYASWYDYVLQLAAGVTAREMSEQEKRLLTEEQKEKLNTLRSAFVDLRTAKQPRYMP